MRMYYLGMAIFVICVFVVSFLVYRDREKKLPDWVNGLIYLFMLSMPALLFPVQKFLKTEPHAAVTLMVVMVLCVAAVFGGLSVSARVLKKSA